MKTEWFVYFAGIHALAFAIFHVFFWRIFNWKVELAKVRLPTRAITQMLNNQIIYYAFSTSFLCFFYADALIETSLGNVILALYTGFWLVRLIQQFIFLKHNHWLVYLTTLLFLLGTLLFALPLILK